MSEPIRTCVGCRAREPRAALVRLVVADRRVIVDERHGLPGRGVHLHPGPSCLAAALRKRAIPRGLRAPDACVDGLAGHPAFAA